MTRRGLNRTRLADRPHARHVDTSVLLRVVSRAGGVSVGYYSPGKASYLLERYSRAAFIDNTSLPYYIEKVNQ